MRVMINLICIGVVGIITGCTTVNVYNDAEPVIIINKKPIATNPDSPYDRRRNY